MLTSWAGVWLKQSCSSIWSSNYVWVKPEKVSVLLSDKSTVRVPGVTSPTDRQMSPRYHSLGFRQNPPCLPGTQQRQLISHSCPRRKKERTEPNQELPSAEGLCPCGPKSILLPVMAVGQGSAPSASATALSAPEQKRRTTAKSHPVMFILTSLK